MQRIDFLMKQTKENRNDLSSLDFVILMRSGPSLAVKLKIKNHRNEEKVLKIHFHPHLLTKFDGMKFSF